MLQLCEKGVQLPIAGRRLHFRCPISVSRSCCSFPVVFLILLFLPTFYYAVFYNALHYCLAMPFYFFQYPLEVDLPRLVSDIMNNHEPSIQPLNTDRYPIVLDNDHLCRDYDGEQEDIYILYVIMSQVENFAMRQALRSTWAQERVLPGIKTKRMFVLGIRPGDTSIQKQVAMEHQENTDIVQGYFHDHSDQARNNTLKLQLALHWASSRCQGASFIMFTPDDYFVSPFNLARYLRRVDDAELGHFLAGSTQPYDVPARYTSSPNYISLQDYPYMFWPPYPGGGVFLMSQQAAQKLYIAMHYVKSLPYHDVFLGITAWKMKFHIKDVPNLYRSGCETGRQVIHKRHKDVVAACGFDNSEELQRLWQRHNTYMTKIGRS